MLLHTLHHLDSSPYSSGRFICSLCRESGCGPVYHCFHCDFDLHVACTATTKQQNHFTHSQHLLHLSKCPTCRHTCDSCGTKIYTWSFRCDMCDFDIHPTCVRAPRFIMHHSHPHPLTLTKTPVQASASSQRCNGCKKPVTKFFYHCDRPAPGIGSCDFNLHQVCATLPTKLKHAKHPQHVLTLLDQPAQEKTTFTCCECGQESTGWRFHCASCKFNLHPGCGSSVHEIALPQEVSEEEALATTSVNAQAARVLHNVSHVIVPTSDDLEAVERVLHFARELVKGSLPEAKEGSSGNGLNSEEDLCPTCFEGYEPSNPKKVTGCGHHFHLACILDWMERSEFCPICRTAISI